MSEDTTPGKEEVESRREQRPRATQEQLLRWPRAATYDVHGRDCSDVHGCTNAAGAGMRRSGLQSLCHFLRPWRSDVGRYDSREGGGKVAPGAATESNAGAIAEKCGSGLYSPFRRCAILLRSRVRAYLPSFRLPASLGSPGQTVRGLPVRRTNRPLDHLQTSGSPMASPLTGMKVHRTFILFPFAHGLRPSGRPAVVQICSRRICRSRSSSSPPPCSRKNPPA